MNGIVISGTIVILGIVISLIFILSKRNSINKRIAHYEKIRDELTIRKKKKKVEIIKSIDEVSSGTSSGSLLSSLITIVVIIMVGGTIIDGIDEELTNAQINSTMTDSQKTILDLVPLFFIIAAAISLFYSGLRTVGLIGEEKELKSEVMRGIKHYESVRDDLTTRESDKTQVQRTVHNPKRINEGADY